MKKQDSILKKKISVRMIGKLVGATVVTAIVSGVFWHRRDIKRLVEISRM